MRNKDKFSIALTTLLIFILLLLLSGKNIFVTEYGAPPYIEEPDSFEYSLDDPFNPNWIRPDGPVRIGLQVGHWKTDEMPDEQQRIKDSGGGTTGRGIPEWQIVMTIAEITKELLEAEGYAVDLLPATVPIDYWADAFISLHADGSLSTETNGYKIAAYRRDQTGDATILANFIDQEYGIATAMAKDPNITRNMTGYYAFNARRYNHAIHPRTPGVLLETGFATNYHDLNLLLNNPEIPAKGITEGIKLFVQYKGLDKN
jgi:hypothetical protein